VNDLETRVRDALAAAASAEPGPDPGELWARYPRYASRPPVADRRQWWRYGAPFAVAALVALAMTPLLWMSSRAHHAAAPGSSVTPTPTSTTRLTPNLPALQPHYRYENDMRAKYPPTAEHVVHVAAGGRPNAIEVVMWYSRPHGVACAVERGVPNSQHYNLGRCTKIKSPGALVTGRIGGPSFGMQNGRWSIHWFVGALPPSATRLVARTGKGSAVPVTILTGAGQPQPFFFCEYDAFSVAEATTGSMRAYDAHGALVWQLTYNWSNFLIPPPKSHK
jgi:hypothetical protein